MNNQRSISFIVLFFVFFLIYPGNRTEQENAITVEKIFGSKEFKTKSFGPFQWDPSGKSFTILKPSEEDEEISELFRYVPKKKKFRKIIGYRQLIPTGGKKPLTIEDYTISDDGKRILLFTDSEYVWRTKTRGNYWIYDFKSKSLQRIGKNRTDKTMMFAKFSPDGKTVAYVSERDLYVEDPGSGNVTRLTDTGSDTIINGTFDWVYEEEFHMRDGFRWSPDSRHIAFWQFDISGVRDFHMIDYISDTYSKVIPLQYPKAGETNSSCRIGVIPVSGGDVQWVHFEGDPREHYLARMDWAESSEEIVIQRLNREQNRNRIWLFDTTGGSAKNIFTDHDNAWLEVSGDIAWINKGKSFIWISERDGWRHLYSVSRDGKTVRLLTPGEFDVMSIEGIDEKRGLVYYIASPDNPARRYLYASPVNGEPWVRRITPLNMNGTHRYDISENGLKAVHYHSSFTTPTVIDLIRLPLHKREFMLEDNSGLAAKLKKTTLPKVEFFRIPIEEEIELDGYMMKPADFDPSKKYPVIFYVYGEPWGQTVRDSWGGNSFMWHSLLTAKGYIIISVDNRGTPSPRGRDFRKVVYGKLGTLTSLDQSRAVKALLKMNQFIDSERIGVWGWSGGGSMTLSLMFRYPDIYKTGISVAPVSDMRYYDSVYQERYMGHPDKNREGYKDGSPITHAKGLKGNLLIIHGTGDDNVHYQNTEAVIDKLIEHKKQFSMMAYPNRRHSIREGKNTKVHLYTLMTRFFMNNL